MRPPHTYICVYIGAYSPAATAEAAQRKREEEEAAERAAAGTHFTSITGTKVQILTYCCDGSGGGSAPYRRQYSKLPRKV